MAKHRDYFFYSFSTTVILRHKGIHKKDGSVCFQRYANLMYGQMMKVGDYYRQFNHENYDEWGWQSYSDLLWYVKAGCNKPRFELLAPPNCSAGGHLDALVHLSRSQNVVAIRAMGGHSKFSVDPAQMSRAKVTHETFPRLYHVTYWSNIDSIYDIGLRPGGLGKNGRQESFFSCKSQADPEAQKEYYTACNNSQRNKSSLPAHVGYPYDKGDANICIDTKLAEECGAEFWQNGSFAILASQPIPPNRREHKHRRNLKAKTEFATIGATIPER